METIYACSILSIGLIAKPLLYTKLGMVSLVDQGKNITPLRVAGILKISQEVLQKYPQVVHILEQYGYKKRKSRSAREEELLRLIKGAIHACKDSEQPIIQQSLSKLVGLSCYALRCYTQVRALMTQAATDDRQQRRERRLEAREEELTQLVVEALELLRDQNRPVTQRAIEKLVHHSNVCSRYPKVRVLIESAMQVQHNSKELNLG
jgi:hypothetical protein